MYHPLVEWMNLLLHYPSQGTHVKSIILGLMFATASQNALTQWNDDYVAVVAVVMMVMMALMRTSSNLINPYLLKIMKKERRFLQLVLLMMHAISNRIMFA